MKTNKAVRFDLDLFHALKPEWFVQVTEEPAGDSCVVAASMYVENGFMMSLCELDAGGYYVIHEDNGGMRFYRCVDIDPIVLILE